MTDRIPRVECRQHHWRLADHIVDYSPSSYRVCYNCNVIQVLRFNGWGDFIQLPFIEFWEKD